MTVKYAKIIDESTKLCDVGLGTNVNLYKSLGMVPQDVEEAYNGNWYLAGYAPAKPQPTLEETLEELEKKYNMPRVIREGILGNPSMYSEFNVNKARELELYMQKYCGCVFSEEDRYSDKIQKDKNKFCNNK